MLRHFSCRPASTLKTTLRLTEASPCPARSFLYFCQLLPSPLLPSPPPKTPRTPRQIVFQPAASLVSESIPPIAQAVADKADPYTESCSAAFLGLTPRKRSLLISTRFGSTAQVHRLAKPMGARTQLTFFRDRVAGVDDLHMDIRDLNCVQKT